MASLVTLLRDMCYPTPRELGLAAHALADEHPDEVRLRQAGTSRAGQPLWVLSVAATGGAPRGADRSVLVVAGAHANEPVGGATALSLARRLLDDPTPRAGCGWHFLLCADPDGANLHRTPSRTRCWTTTGTSSGRPAPNNPSGRRPYCPRTGCRPRPWP